MPDRQLNYRVTVDQSAGTAGIRDFSRTVTSELRKVDQSFEDTETAAQRAARVMGQMADQAETELAAAARAADALGNAMGPELAAKLGRNGIAQAIGDLTKMGVTFDEIEANADELARSIARIDEVQTSAVDQGLGNLGGKLRDVRGEADQSRSVLANMAGNSAQSLGELGGVVGDLGVGIGQIAEYATEGNIRLSNLAQVAGPMAMLAVATQAFSAVLEGIDFSKTFKAEQVKDWTEAIKAGETSLVHLEDAARNAELQVDAAGGGFLGLSRHAEDLAPHLQTLNLSVEDFNRLVQQGSPELAKLRAEYNRLVTIGPRATDEQDRLATAMGYVIGAAEDQADAIATANDEMARIAEITKPSTEAVKEAVDAWKLLKDPVSAMPEAFDRIATAMRDGVVPAAGDMDAVMDKTGMTMQEVFDTADGLNRKLADNQRELDQTARSSGRLLTATEQLDRQWQALTGTLDDDSAFLSVQDAFDDVRDKGAEAWEASKNGAADAEQKSRDYQQSLIDAKQDVIRLGQQIGLSVPQTKELLLLIDDHEIDEVERRLAIMSRNRTMQLSIVTNGGRAPGEGQGFNGQPFPGMAPTPPPAGRTLTADDPAAPAATAAVVPDLVFPVVVSTPTASSLTLDMRGAILGSRYDIVRTVRAAARDGVRLAGLRGQRP